MNISRPSSARSGAEDSSARAPLPAGKRSLSPADDSMPGPRRRLDRQGAWSRPPQAGDAGGTAPCRSAASRQPVDALLGHERQPGPEVDVECRPGLLRLPPEILQGPLNQHLSLLAQARLQRTSRSAQAQLGVLPQRRDDLAKGFKSLAESLVRPGELSADALQEVALKLENRVLPRQQVAEIADGTLGPKFDELIAALEDGILHSERQTIDEFKTGWTSVADKIVRWTEPVRALALCTMARRIAIGLEGQSKAWIVFPYDLTLNCDPASNELGFWRLHDMYDGMRHPRWDTQTRDEWEVFLNTSKERAPIFHGIELLGVAGILNIHKFMRNIRRFRMDATIFNDILDASQDASLPPPIRDQIHVVLKQKLACVDLNRKLADFAPEVHAQRLRRLDAGPGTAMRR